MPLPRHAVRGRRALHPAEGAGPKSHHPTTKAFHGKGVYCEANQYLVTNQTAPLQYLVLTCILTWRPYTSVMPMNSMGLPPKYDSALVNQDKQDCFYVSFEDEKIYPVYLLELALR